MSAELRKAVDALFSPESDRIGNVKFFRGRLTSGNAERLLEQFVSANRQVKDGSSKPHKAGDGQR